MQEEVAKSVLSSVCQVSAILEKEEVEEYNIVVGREEGVEDLVYNRARLVGGDGMMYCSSMMVVY